MARALEQVQADIRALLFTTRKERAALGLPLDRKEAWLEIEKLIGDHFEERGELLHANKQGYIMLENGVPILITHDGNDLSTLLNRDYLISPGDPNRKKLGLYLTARCTEKPPVQLHVGSYYDQESNRAYLAESRGWLIRITGATGRLDCGGLERVPNGTDGVYFLFPPESEDFHWEQHGLDCEALSGPMFAFDLEEETPESEFETLLFNGVRFKESALSTQEKKLLLKLYIITLFMDGLCHERPLLLLLGPTGSGKTFLARCIGIMAVGPSFNVVGFDGDRKEIENKLVNNSFVAWDDPGSISREDAAQIRRAVTGGKMQRRNLFTTAQQAEMPYIANIALSTVEQPFHAEEDTNRQLCLTLEKRGGNNISEALLLRGIKEKRPCFLHELASTIVEVLSALKETENDPPPQVPVRLAGFATLLIKLFRYNDPANPDRGEKLARGIIERWQLEQTGGIFVNNDLAEALGLWFASDKFAREKWYTAGELLNELKCHTAGRPYWSESGEKLARELVRSENAYAKYCGLRVEKNPHLKVRRYSFNPPEENAPTAKGSRGIGVSDLF